MEPALCQLYRRTCIPCYIECAVRRTFILRVDVNYSCTSGTVWRNDADTDKRYAQEVLSGISLGVVVHRADERQKSTTKNANKNQLAQQIRSPS